MNDDAKMIQDLLIENRFLRTAIRKSNKLICPAKGCELIFDFYKPLDTSAEIDLLRHFFNDHLML